MNVRVFRHASGAARSVADTIARQIQAHPRTVLGLPTGRTSVAVFEELVRLHNAGKITFSRVHTFNLDEFVGLNPQDPRSFRAFMDRHLFRHVDIPAEHIHFLDGSSPSLQRECAEFERAIEALGGIDLQILGLGGNGHIGFNEPGTHLRARTHRVQLAPGTRRANAMLFGNRPTAVPHDALSMGIGKILAARAIVLIATGRPKARAVKLMVAGPITTRVPASFLQLHANTDIVLDEAAAGRLDGSREVEV